MTQVDFYIIDQDSPEARLTVACRIAEKAMHSDCNVFIRTASAAESERLDDLLWTFSQGSFVPHRIATAPGGPGLEPVLIGHDLQFAGASADLIINLAAEVPEAFDRYPRIAELVDNDATRRAQGRERFRYYRDQGCEPATHRL